MSFTSVSAASMQAGIEALRKANSNLQSALETLKGQLSNSLALWDGAAQRAYHTVQARWDKQAVEMNNIVNTMAVRLGNISQRYDDNERRVAGRWGG